LGRNAGLTARKPPPGGSPCCTCSAFGAKAVVANLWGWRSLRVGDIFAARIDRAKAFDLDGAVS
jgi:hypothetical protein